MTLSATEQDTGVGLSSVLRAHCVQEWNNIITVAARDGKCFFTTSTDGVELDKDRVVRFINYLKSIVDTGVLR